MMEISYENLGMRKKNKLAILTFASLFLLCGCSLTNKKHIENDSLANSASTQEHLIQSVLWQQQSGEYRALAHQAYNLAQLELDIILKDEDVSNGKKLAIVTDIDETVLDNSPYFAKMIELNKGFDKEEWVKWGKLKKANSVPGAPEFFRYAASKNITVFYISNRYINQLDDTVDNLKNNGFPYADSEHVILKKEGDIGKGSRTKKTEETYKIIMLVGDNLSDFSSEFDGNSTESRNVKVDSLKKSFGAKFIVLPNPIYGNWETDGIYNGRYNWSPIKKDSIRHSKLISY